MNAWINLGLDLLLIALVTAGLIQATRLIRHLAGLQQGRVEMERFVREFSATVARAENGIKGLRDAARNTGDDLEKLLEKSVLVRDELSFIVESADQLAGRLSESASSIARAPAKVAEPPPAPAPLAAVPAAPAQTAAPKENVTPFVARKPAELPSASAASRAERELLQALEKLG